MKEKITYAGITQNRIGNIKRNIPKVIDCVDRIVIVDGFSTDGTKEWLDNYGSPKITVVQHEWDDNFSHQHNEYLRQITDGWVLVCDDDELPSRALLESLPQVIEESNDGNIYCVAEFRSHGMEIDEAGNILNDGGPNNFWKEIFFKYNTGMEYTVNLHQSLGGHYKHEKKHKKPEMLKRRNEVYYHLKTNKQMYRGACRNWWVAGIWPGGEIKEGIRCPEWYEMKMAVAQVYPEVKVYRDFDKIMVKGNMDKRIKDFFYKYKDISDEPSKNRFMNELRAYWKYYFQILHPNEIGE